MMINGTWLCLVSIGQYWLVCGGNGSVWGGIGCYLVEMGQYGWSWLVLGGNGSVYGGTG